MPYKDRTKRHERLMVELTYTCLVCSNEFHPYRPGQSCCNGVCRNTLIARKSAKQSGNKQRGRGAGKTYIKQDGQHQHRVIAAQKLGRALLPGEIVHHIDHNRRNNSPDNLEVLPSQSAHCKEHGFGTKVRSK